MRVGYFHDKEASTQHIDATLEQLRQTYKEASVWSGAQLVDNYRKKCANDGTRFTWEGWAQACADLLDVVVLPRMGVTSRGTANVALRALDAGKTVQSIDGRSVRVTPGRNEWEYFTEPVSPTTDNDYF